VTDPRLQVLHLIGSPTSAFFADLSVLYAADCLQATADDSRYRFHIAYVSPDGRWRFPPALTPAALESVAPLPMADAIAELGRRCIDVAVPQMFCLDGMTTYRALLDACGIPYVGNRPDVMALGADKAKAKALVAGAGVLTPESQVVRTPDAVSLELPVVVKPVDADNSAGVTLVRNPSDLPAAVGLAMEHGSAALVERYVPLGREVRCGLLESDGRLIGLPLEEYRVDSETKPIRDAADKVARRPEGELRLVAKGDDYASMVDLSDPLTAAVGEAARRCHLALGCRHYSLFDFRIDPSGRPWFLEAGLYWSFAHQSVLSAMAAAHGLDLQETFADLLSVARSDRRTRGGRPGSAPQT
jgi:D-alanine-D-alanine ligase